MATTALFGNMLNQKTKRDAPSRKPKNIEELRQMAKAKMTAKKKAIKKPISKAKKK